MPKRNKDRMRWLVLLVLPALVAALYGSFLYAPFVYDDRIHILENQDVISFRGLFDFSAMRKLLDHPFGLAARPLLFITYGLTYGAFGSNPAAFRLTNFVIHAANSILVFLIAFELGALASRRKKDCFRLGLLAGALFAAHPLLTESVTYIAGRSSSLCGVFYFAGLYFVMRAGHAEGRGRAILMILAGVAALSGWLLKQDAITLPAAAIAFIWLIWPKAIGNRRRLAITACLLVLTGSVLLFQYRSIALLSATTQSNDALAVAGFERTVPFIPYVLTSIREYSAYYLWRLFLPVHLSVDPDPAIAGSPLSLGVLVSITCIACLAVGAIWLRGRRPIIAAGILLILVSPLSAYCVFPLADIIAEHRAYISALGAVIVLADLVLASRHAIPVSIGFVIFFGWLTIARNQIWNDEVLLWRDAADKAPSKVRPHLNLGALYQVRGDSDRATQEYEQALSLNPSNGGALSNLASLYLARNDLTKTELLLNRAVAEHSQFAAVYVNLAVVRLRQDRLKDARDLLDRALALNPAQLMIHHNLGDILFNEKHPDGAIVEYEAELRLNPKSMITHLNLAKAYENTGSREKSIEHYLIVERADPANAEVRAALLRLK